MKPLIKADYSMVYLSQTTLLDTYDTLTSIEIENASIFHIFLILKSCGFNDLSYLSTDAIANKGIPYTYNLSSLFSPKEKIQDKYNFINPFSMQTWGQEPSESLKKWVSSRIKNNVIGGATTWRRIVKENIFDNEIKFSHNYIEEIKELTIGRSKINLWALSLWYHKYFQFEHPVSPLDIVNGFIKDFNISEKEKLLLFDTSIGITLEFSEEIVDMSQIRQKIGSPPSGIVNWVDKIEETEISVQSTQVSNLNKFLAMTTSSRIDVSKVMNLLLTNYQVILSGPPGTSKSYLADAIGKQFVSEFGEESIVKVQFHPQFSYQDFIGGFIVQGDQVNPNRGILLKLIDKAKLNQTKKYLLVIDEINRANVSSVFGEVIQCLDRNYKTTLLLGGTNEEICIPSNLFIIATMNTADRTLGIVDFALRRRFIDIYVGVNESELIDMVTLSCGSSAADLLTRINNNLRNTLKNNELVIGQTIFYNPNKKLDTKYVWGDQDLEDLFNYKLLPIIESYSNKDQSKIIDIVGSELSKRLIGEEFITSLKRFIAGEL